MGGDLRGQATNLETRKFSNIFPVVNDTFLSAATDTDEGSKQTKKETPVRLFFLFGKNRAASTKTL